MFTHRVRLWILNDEYLYTLARIQARRAVEGNDDAADVAANLRDIVTGANDPGVPELTGVRKELFDAAVDEVDWNELADELIEELKAEEGE